MSKHSKWAKVKHQKGTTDSKRAAVFTKLARVITVAAREGGSDPNFNFKLRTAIELAQAGSMPKDNIERAIKRGSGGAEGENIEEVTYEGYGPGGAAVVVEALTSNRNRTSSNIKHILSVHGGNLGSAGSVLWMFVRKSVLRIERAQPLGEAEELALIDAGAEDIAADAEGLDVTGPVEALNGLREAADKLGLKVVGAGLEWLPKEMLAVADPEAQAKLEGLFEALDDDEDVNNIYYNVDI
ncbi:MAG: YebC/PmpR family DNA-binding transcriptional regulator [Patescibacteria group bacterium]|jgi:YebC/PmpR family DNA-binding regulatory protein